MARIKGARRVSTRNKGGSFLETIKEWAQWIGVGRTLSGVVVGAFFAGVYYSEAYSEIQRYKKRVNDLEKSVAALAKKQEETGPDVTKRFDLIIADLDQQFERLTSERRIVTPKSVDAPIVGSSTDGRCASGEYVAGIQIAGLGSGSLGSSGRITYLCANFPRLRLSKR